MIHILGLTLNQANTCMDMICTIELNVDIHLSIPLDILLQSQVDQYLLKQPSLNRVIGY